MDTYVFAGGGSGGHLFPAIAVARELQSRAPDCRIVFIGGRRPIEGDILSRESFEHRTLDVSPSSDLVRHPIRFAWRYWRALTTATVWLRQWRPRAVIGCGGYVSVPVGMAARKVGVPLVLLEQNVVPGRATSWLARRADVVCTSFEDTAVHLPRIARINVTGNPVRPEIAALAAQPQAPLNAPLTLLVLGGSQGAASVNTMLLKFAERHPEALAGWRIVHQAGARDEAVVRRRYAELAINANVSAFIVEIARAYAAAHLIVSRAGATTLAEVACAGRPALLIPYPGAVRDHQEWNAEFVVRAGAAVLVKDGAADELAATLLPLLQDQERRRRMAEQMRRLARPSAIQHVADAVLQTGQKAKPAGGAEHLRPVNH